MLCSYFEVSLVFTNKLHNIIIKKYNANLLSYFDKLNIL